MRVVLAAALLCLGIAAADAHARHDRHHQRHPNAHRLVAPVRIAHFAHDPRPAAWCGWFMRQIKHVVDRAYNLARKWAHWGYPLAGPAIGAVVVWPHHVGEIVGGPDARGRWLVHSGNDGHAVRTRYRSLAGAIAFRQG